MTGEAFTLVSPEERHDFGKIERAVGAKIERAQLEGFAYEATPEAAGPATNGERARGSGRARRPSRKAGAEKGPGKKPPRPRRRRYGKRRG
jgi:hypothetical protein